MREGRSLHSPKKDGWPLIPHPRLPATHFRGQSFIVALGSILGLSGFSHGTASSSNTIFIRRSANSKPLKANVGRGGGIACHVLVVDDSTAFQKSRRGSGRFLCIQIRHSASLSFKKIGVFLFLALVSFLWLARKQRDWNPSSFRFYNQFLERMARSGHPKAPEETGQEFVRRLEARWPEQAVLAHKITDRYYGLRFRRNIL